MPTPLTVYRVSSEDNARLKAPDWFCRPTGRLGAGDVVLCTGKGTSAAWAYLLLQVDATGIRAVSLGDGDARQFLELQGTSLGTPTRWQPTRREAMYLQAGDVLRGHDLAHELGRALVVNAPKAKAAVPVNGDRAELGVSHVKA
jgi:hypothetical protein